MMVVMLSVFWNDFRGMSIIALTLIFCRRAENPIANSTSVKTRLLSKAHLHALYAKLLVLPFPLS